MSRQESNATFALTSFLYGGNAAYIEDLYAKYEADPTSVDAEWRDFFKSLKDEGADVIKSARGASWKKSNWPQRENGDRYLADALQQAEGSVTVLVVNSLPEAGVAGVNFSHAGVMQAR